MSKDINSQDEERQSRGSHKIVIEMLTVINDFGVEKRNMQLWYIGLVIKGKILQTFWKLIGLYRKKITLLVLKPLQCFVISPSNLKQVHLFNFFFSFKTMNYDYHHKFGTGVLEKKIKKNFIKMCGKNWIIKKKKLSE